MNYRLMMPVIYLIIISFCGGQEFSRCHFGNWIYYGGKDEKADSAIIDQLKSVAGGDVSAESVSPRASEVIQIQTSEGMVKVESLSLKGSGEVYTKSHHEKDELEKIVGKKSRKELSKLGLVPLLSLPKRGPVTLYNLEGKEKWVAVFRLWNGKSDIQCRLYLIAVFGNPFVERPELIAFREASPK